MEQEPTANDSMIEAVARLLEWPLWVPAVVALLVWGAWALLHRRTGEGRHEPD
ncbi:hypothetical protein ENKNEFLB_02174 [Nocardioides aquaticus]|uniref:Uncharacterized protein n=1 Tax=Nocardioides aquaticus TaxID=160826 RepID=A0ABX8EGY2_9ACTN|nr:hypothetical protein [Nocardioides aquaticus]QVT79784.1 hypothetical protein ENKNEFLB_02174 [Nocardioides aquaticus]